jgi:hypothetical protein
MGGKIWFVSLIVVILLLIYSLPLIDTLFPRPWNYAFVIFVMTFGPFGFTIMMREIAAGRKDCA